MIPPHEISLLLTLMVEAVSFAEEGNLVAGYTLLLVGRRRAQTFADRGEPWGPELVLRYREAIANYVDWYGIPLD